MGAWVPVAYRPDDIIVLRRNPVLLEGRRERQPAALSRRDDLQALDLGGPRRAGGGRHRRLLQPRTGGKLRRGAEALCRSQCPGPPRLRRPDDRLLDLHELLGQWLGPARRPGTGGARAQPQPRLPPGGDLGDRPRAPRPVAGQGAVHGDLSRRPLCRHRVLRQGLDGLLSVRPRRGQGGTRQGRTQGHRRRRHPSTSRPTPPAARTCRSRCWPTRTTRPTRTSPKAWSRPWRRSASASSSISSPGRT